MIIIQTKSQDCNYIVGIFKDDIEAIQYLAKLDDDKFIMSALAFEFPFIIIERLVDNVNIFDFYQNIIDINLRDNEITQYSVRDEFQPSDFGKDEMGKISHIHIVD